MAKRGKRKAESIATGEDNTKRSKSGNTKIQKTTVQLDNLHWQAVEVPGKLDDYEGFYGLEEVNDVEVVREGEKVSFKSAIEVDEDVVMSNVAASEEASDDIEESEDEDNDEEWNGFSDDDDIPDMDEMDLKDDPQSPTGQKMSTSKPLSQAKRPKVVDNQELGSLSFAHLDEIALDEDSDVDDTDMTAWEQLGLSSELLSAVAGLNFTKPTPIQIASIPVILEGRDVVGKADTGSGKTLAFGLPIIEKYLEQTIMQGANITHQKHDRAWALILSPTRELAHQIGHHLEALCEKGSFEAPRIAIVTGGLAVQKQERLLPKADIVVATPGRLHDILNSSKDDILHRLRGIRYLVLDEADRLISKSRRSEEFQDLPGLISDLSASNEDDKRPITRRTLLFSATFDRVLELSLGQNKLHQLSARRKEEQTLEWLTRNFTFDDPEGPEWIDVNQTNRLAEGIKEGLVECGNMEKDLYLYAVLMLHPRTRTLVFFNSISAVRRITPFLQNLELPAQSLHSSMAQKARLRAIEKFKSAESSILIATDVAARGLDIPGVQLIIHYHLPRTAEMYVHRSGRTARGENNGASIILCSPEENAGVKRLIGQVHENRGHAGRKYTMQVIDIDRRVVSRLKPRVIIAKKIADVGVAKEKGRSDDQFFREAAEELGVEYDSEEMDKLGGGKHGRGNVRKQREREDRGVNKAQLVVWKGELKHLLAQRVNVGVSERYLAQGVVDVNALLKGEKGEFLGTAKGIDLLTD